MVGKGKATTTFPTSFVPDSWKTDRMRVLEVIHRKPIEELICDEARPLRVMAKQLGVSASTISTWRRELYSRWHGGKLPACSGCPFIDHTCQVLHLCHILVKGKAGLDLVLAKSKELVRERVNATTKS